EREDCPEPELVRRGGEGGVDETEGPEVRDRVPRLLGRAVGVELDGGAGDDRILRAPPAPEGPEEVVPALLVVGGVLGPLDEILEPDRLLRPGPRVLPRGDRDGVGPIRHRRRPPFWKQVSW